MAATCLDRCRDGDTSVHLCIACPDEHILYPLNSHENVELEMVPEEPLNGKKPEETQFKTRSWCELQRRRLRRSKLAIQKGTERPNVLFRERIERSKESFKKRVRTSKNSLKEKIRASQEMMGQLAERMKECFVTNVSKLRPVCGRNKGMLLRLVERVDHLAVD